MVFLGVNKTNNEKVAIKVLDSKKIKSSKYLCDLQNELQVHWSLKDCDGILQLRNSLKMKISFISSLDFKRVAHFLIMLFPDKNLTKLNAK
jgi:hypothetical protein